MKILLFSIFLLSACAVKRDDYKRVNLEEYYLTSGVVRYFLPDLPNWANYSHSASCRRDYSVRFLNFEILRKSFNLSYFQATQMQYVFNKDYNVLKNKHGVEYISLKDEEKLFYQSLEQINAKLFPFKRPNYKRINLIWVDPILDKPDRLKKLMARNEMNLGHPVFVSMCMNSKSLRKFVSNNLNDSEGMAYLPFEMMGPFNGKKELVTRIGINVEMIFEEKQKIYMYVPKESSTEEFFGKYKALKY